MLIRKDKDDKLNKLITNEDFRELYKVAIEMYGIEKEENIKIELINHIILSLSQPSSRNEYSKNVAEAEKWFEKSKACFEKLKKDKNIEFIHYYNEYLILMMKISFGDEIKRDVIVKLLDRFLLIEKMQVDSDFTLLLYSTISQLCFHTGKYKDTIKYSKKIKVFQKSLNQNQEYYSMLYEMLSYIKIKKIDEALSIIKEYLYKQDKGVVLDNYNNILIDLFNYNYLEIIVKLAKEVSSSLEITNDDRTSQNIQFITANWLIEKNDFQGAVTTLTEIVRTKNVSDFNTWQIMINYANCLCYIKKCNEAEKILEDIIRNSDMDEYKIFAHCLLAELCIEKEAHHRAIMNFEKAIELDGEVLDREQHCFSIIQACQAINDIKRTIHYSLYFIENNLSGDRYLVLVTLTRNLHKAERYDEFYVYNIMLRKEYPLRKYTLENIILEKSAKKGNK